MSRTRIVRRAVLVVLVGWLAFAIVRIALEPGLPDVVSMTVSSIALGGGIAHDYWRHRHEL